MCAYDCSTISFGERLFIWIESFPLDLDRSLPICYMASRQGFYTLILQKDYLSTISTRWNSPMSALNPYWTLVLIRY